MDNAQAFGPRLKQRRKALDLTQARLAELVGCAVETIRKIEAGRLRPSRQVAERLAQYLEIPPDDRLLFVQHARTRPDTAAPTRTAAASASSSTTQVHRSLPQPKTSLIGRAKEVATVCTLLERDDIHILTLVGPPGIGKTRLSVQAALELQNQFTHGAYFVPLAPITDPHLVMSTIAQQFQITELVGTSPLERMKDVLRDRHMLLVLDNFEQVVESAPLLAELLSAAPRLTILVTSRTPLHIYGEHQYAVPPLALPTHNLTHKLPPVEQLQQYESVRLFMERAQAVDLDFALTVENAPVVVEICTRLDGLPLAIELAAARMKLLTPQELLRRLDQRLVLLTKGPHDLPPRQQTLRGAIEWSYELLSPDEQQLFRRLGIFVGGFTVAGAEAVCWTNNEAGDALDGLEALLDHSLLYRAGATNGESRFGMLETIREYALERLTLSGEVETIRQQHALYYTALAESAVDGRDPLTNRLSNRLIGDMDNFRATLRWSLTTGEPTVGLRLAEVLVGEWAPLGLHAEGRQWLADLLARVPNPIPERVGGLNGAAYLALRQGDYPAAAALLEESVPLAIQLHDNRRNTHGRLLQGMLAHALGDPEQAMMFYEMALADMRAAQDRLSMTGVLRNLADLAYEQRDLKRARATYEETLAVARSEDHTHDYAYALRGLAHVARVMGDQDQATALYLDSLRIFQQIKDRRCIPFCLEGLACVASLTGAGERAARLFGAAEALREAIGVTLPPAEHDDHHTHVAKIRFQLDAVTFARAWAEGRAMTMDQALAEAVHPTS